MAEVRHSTCALDCPDSCGLLINVEDGRGSRLRGNPDHPITRGFLCAKVTKYLEREYSPDRLLYPQKRVGAKGEGRFARISWDEALDTIAARFRRLTADPGPESILPYSYGGSLGYLQANGMDRRFFHRLGASRLDRTICSTAGGAALMQTLGARYGTEPSRNARVNGQLAQLVQRIALADLVPTIEHYLRSENAWYAQRGHSVAALLQDAEKLCTEARTGVHSTAYGARRVDKLADRREQYEDLFAELRALDATNAAKEAE